MNSKKKYHITSHCDVEIRNSSEKIIHRKAVLLKTFFGIVSAKSNFEIIEVDDEICG